MDTSSTNYALLLLDLDGTLLGRDQRIAPRVARAVRRAAERMHVSIATGRERADAIKFAAELGLTTPQISDNGALIVDPATSEALWSSLLGTELSRRVILHLRETGTPYMATHPAGTLHPHHEFESLDINRISAMDIPEGRADELVAAFAAVQDLHVVKVYLPYNGLWAVDYTREGVNKGTAALRLAEMLGVNGKKTAAVGDSYNDRQMLEVSTLRIVMADAPAELKAIAHHVAPSVDEDGLADAIERWVVPPAG